MINNSDGKTKVGKRVLLRLSGCVLKSIHLVGNEIQGVEYKAKKVGIEIENFEVKM